jgi:tetraacyldisaccharide 4'-kinase
MYKLFKLKRPDYWNKIGIIAFLLWPFSLSFRLGTLIRVILTSKPYRAKAKIICVGNHVAGGAGKTPICLEIGQYFDQKKTCFVCIGAGGSYRKTQLVRPDIENASAVYGDEALLLASVLPVIVSKNKASGIKLADKFGFEKVIVDDGLQNPGFKKDINILVYNKKAEGNGLIIPAGPCRESLASAIDKVDFIIDFSNELLKGPKVFYAKKIYLCDAPKEKSILFSSIADNESFKEVVLSLGYPVEKLLSFPDHHQYTQDDLDLIFSYKTTTKGKKINYLTTAKDYVKLNDAFKQKTFIVKEKIEIQDNEKLRKTLQEL